MPLPKTKSVTVTSGSPVEIDTVSMNSYHVFSAESSIGTLTIKVKPPGNPEFQNFPNNTIDTSDPQPVIFRIPIEGVELSVDVGTVTVHYIIGYAD